MSQSPGLRPRSSRECIAGVAAIGIAASLWTSVPATAGPPHEDALIAPVGEQAGELFGRRLAAGGDLDGDGWRDVVVGAHVAGAGAGRVAIYFGGPHMDDVADLVLVGQAGERLGTAVAADGDLDGDGHADLVVSAPGSGRVLLYRGGPALDDLPDGELSSGLPGDLFGVTLASVGDLDADGFDDLLVGASTTSVVAPGAGRVYVYRGGTSLPATPALILEGQGAGHSFGAAVAGAGDVDGDGTMDWLVGAFGHDAFGPLTGRAYLYLGGAPLDGGIDRAYTGEVERDRFGFALSPAGDTNADGFDDFLVAAPTHDATGWDAGRVYLYRGGPTAPGAPHLSWDGEAADAQFGWSVCAVGDVQADGFDDVAVGEPFVDLRAPRRGRVLVFAGGASPSPFPVSSLDGDAAGDFFGGWIDGLGDVDGDGVDDFAVGAAENDAGGLDAGRAYVMAGVPAPVNVVAGAPSGLSVRAQPNPFDRRTQLLLELPPATPVTVGLFDLVGRRVRSWTWTSAGGDDRLDWDGRDATGRQVAAGTYLVRVRAGWRLHTIALHRTP